MMDNDDEEQIEDQNEAVPDLIAQMDQLKMSIATLMKLTFHVYKQAIDEGFSHEMAFEMAKMYMGISMSQGM